LENVIIREKLYIFISIFFLNDINRRGH